jgi:hypothetical protein
MLARCIRKNQIPTRYQNYPMIGQGTTSIVLQKDQDTVLMLTRDKMKEEWLRFGPLESKLIDEFATYGHHIRGMDELPVFAVEMPLLSPLSFHNRRLVRQIVKEFDSVWSKSLSETQGGHNNLDDAYTRLAIHYGYLEEHLLYPLIQFTQNYYADYFSYDLGVRNFLQDANGHVQIVDPVFSKELGELIYDWKRQKYEGQYLGHK